MSKSDAISVLRSYLADKYPPFEIARKRPFMISNNVQQLPSLISLISIDEKGYTLKVFNREECSQSEATDTFAGKTIAGPYTGTGTGTRFLRYYNGGFIQVSFDDITQLRINESQPFEDAAMLPAVDRERKQTFLGWYRGDQPVDSTSFQTFVSDDGSSPVPGSRFTARSPRDLMSALLTLCPNIR
jgi:hypothetical protein